VPGYHDKDGGLTRTKEGKDGGERTEEEKA